MGPIQFRPPRSIAWAVAVAALASARPTAETPRSLARPDAPASAAYRARGIQFTYSLDYDEARAALRQAIAADPGDPAGYRQLAAVNWLNLLFRSGAVLVDDYMGEVQQNLAHLPEEDLKVIIAYLKQLPPVDSPPRPQRQCSWRSPP